MAKIKLGEHEFPVSDILTALGDNYVIRTKAEEASYWDNTVKKTLDTKVKEMYESFETEIASTTGVERENGEKAYDYLKRSVGDINTKHADEVKDLNKKLTEKLKDSEAANEVTKQFDAFKEKQQLKMAELEGTIENLNKSNFQNKIDAKVDEAIERIRPTLKKDIPEFLVNNTIDAIKADFKSKTIAKDINGAIVFNDLDDKPIVNDKDGNVLSAYDIIIQKFPEDVFDKKRKQDGTGTPPVPGKAADPDNKFDIALPAEVKTVTQLIDHISTQTGIKPNTQEFNQYYKANKAKVEFKL